MHLIRQQFFTIGLFAAVVLALVVPEPGARGGWLHPELATKLGVAIIFFLQGLSLATQQMLSGLRPLRLHAFCLSWNFVWFPIFTGLLLLPLSLFLDPGLCLGLWMISILPTTISSATALTSIAEGGVPQAIFSSVLSNLLAVFLVPLLCLFVLSTETGGSIPLLPVFGDLSLLVFLPLFLGQCLRRFSRPLALKVVEPGKIVTQLIILFIVYASFAESVQSGVLFELGRADMLAACGSIALLLVGSSVLVWWSSGWFRFERKERIAGFYCAGQKSLATGLPLLKSIFLAAGLEEKTALVLIPLILFHPAQLFLGAWLVSRFRVYSSR